LQLSKSGKVVNMYNTMKMAKRVSKKEGLTDIVHRVSGTIFKSTLLRCRNHSYIEYYLDVILLMEKKNIALAMIICFSGLHAQENNSLYKTKKIPFSRDTIYLENESLNASYFKLLDANNTAINSTLYNVDFLKGTLL
jgi:hypothetical protein